NKYFILSCVSFSAGAGVGAANEVVGVEETRRRQTRGDKQEDLQGSGSQKKHKKHKKHKSKKKRRNREKESSSESGTEMEGVTNHQPSSSEKRRTLDESIQSTQGPFKGLQLSQLPSSPARRNIKPEKLTESGIELLSPEQSEKPSEKKDGKAEDTTQKLGSDASHFALNQSISTDPDQSREPGFSQLKGTEYPRSGGRKSRRSHSRSVSRDRRRATYSQRDRWKREPSHSPVLILRKNRSPIRKHCSSSNSPQRISELATMTAALSNIGTLSSLLPLPSITNKPPPVPAQHNILALEEVKRKVVKQANSISIKEFTDKCKMIVDSKGELPVAVPHVSDEEDDGKPFGGSALREQKVISFSINNTTVRPTVRSDAGMAKEFPVSSGSQHRKKEGEALGAYGEWVPVDKTDKAAAISRKAPTTVPITRATSSSGETTITAAGLPQIVEQTAFVPDDSVFPDPLLQQSVDISQAVTERIKAQRRLAENPYDVSAICMLSRAQEQDQFLRAAPVSGGVGEFLMRKMGWKTGEGLGRNREGTVEPIIIDFKVDRKGLVAEGEKPQKQTGGLVVTKDLMGKHPVSALIELCNKRRIMQPDFVMVHHSGPDHRKNFLFKVTVNGVDYQPQTASPNKKHAKAMAATVALQALGEVPVDGPGLYTGPVFTAASTGPLFST
ncbi:Protein SON, partial [Nibea albiflora]